MKKSLRLHFGLLSLTVCWLLMLVAAEPTFAAGAPPAESLTKAKSLYVGAFSGGPDSPRLHDTFVHHLAGSRFKLVQSPTEADAIVTGNGEIWVRGHIAINPRSPSTDREAVYGGYLSVEVTGKDGQPLWSWLATPSKHAWSDIVADLAGQAARKLIHATDSAPTQFASPVSGGDLAQTSLIAAGATFPAPIYQKWFEDFEQIHPGVQIHYSPVGSQLGDEQLVAGKLDFAGSDVTPEVSVSRAQASDLRSFATVLGAVVPIYNIKGVTQDLHFTPEALADIYLGRVRRWNDAEIQRLNKGIKLPDAEIVAVHRSDGSGTTWVWSDFLSKVSTAWSSSIGRGTTLDWPTGVGAEGNEGVADRVKSTSDSIGYVELTYAIQHQLSFGAVRNRAGEYIRADNESVVEGAGAWSDGDEHARTITDPIGKGAYPIAAFTWFVVPSRTADPAKRAALNELLRWVLTSGQKECAALGYVPLPRETVDRELQMLSGNP